MAHEDANAAYKWVAENAASWNGEPKKLALVGESAGGSLAVNVAIAGRDQKMEIPLYVVAVYPVAAVDTNSASYQKNAKSRRSARRTWIELVGKADLKGLPPKLVITAEIDPLMTENELLAEKLKQAGVKTTYEYVDAVNHEFFSMGVVVKDADKAEDMAAKELVAASSRRRAPEQSKP